MSETTLAAPAVRTEKTGHIFEIILNRPEKRNAINLEVLDGLAAAAEQAANDTSVRVVLLHGEGKAFSAGLDFGMAMAGGINIEPSMATFRFQLTERLQRPLTMLENMDKPVIAILHGVCIGFGLEIALAADLRVAHPDVKLSLPETRLGLVPDVGGTTRLLRTVGRSRAKDIIFTAREVPTEEALRIGLVDRVDLHPLAEGRTLAEQIAGNAPMAVGLAKRVIERSGDVDKRTSFDLEGMAQSMCLRSQDFMEGIQAAVMKRKPEFKGE
jgi:enoyl-CoA hydratase/carnithine racemase